MSLDQPTQIHQTQIGTLSHQCLQLLYIPGTQSQPSFHDFIPSTTNTTIHASQ